MRPAEDYAITTGGQVHSHSPHAQSTTHVTRSGAIMSHTLFSPTTLGALALPTRIIMAPMTRNRADARGVPTAAMALYYAQRATAALIITEMTQVSPDGQGYALTPGIHTGEQVDAWRRVTRAVHGAGGLIVLQLGHAGRISHPSLQPEGRLPVAPSAIAPEGTAFTPTGSQPFVTPRPLGAGEIPAIVRAFGDATHLAREAGFDGVELHGANGYLLDQFLRDGSNHRTDAYGGAAANRARLLAEVADAAAAAWEPRRVGVRLSPWSPFNSMSDADPRTTFTVAARALRDLGLAYLHVIEDAGRRADRLTAALREAFGGPVIANAGYDGVSAEEALASGEVQAVSFGTPFLANPDLPVRLALGAPLNPPDRATFYGGDARGYTDYPVLEMFEAAA